MKLRRKIALALLAAILPTLFAGCGSRPQPAEPAPKPEPEPVPAPEPEPLPESEPEPLPPLTREEMQAAAVQTALAYYYHNPYVQYDSTLLTAAPKASGIVRNTSGDAPEAACSDYNIFTVCSDFCYDIFYNAFGYSLMGKPTNCSTNNMTALPEDDIRVVWHYDAREPYTDIATALRDCRAALQPGDVLVCYSTESSLGHAMFYAGDLLGDGKGYLLHSNGSKVNIETGVDSIEAEGSIWMSDVDDFCFNPDAAKKVYLGTTRRGQQISVLRPLDDIEAQGLDVTPSARARLDHPRLAVTREFSQSRYQDVTAGDTVTVTLKLENHSNTAYSVSVSELLPEGQTLIPGSVSENVSPENGTLRWEPTLQPGQLLELTYAVTVSGSPGETVTFPGGEVSGIPTLPVSFAVGGPHLTEAQNAAMLALAEKGLPESLQGTEYLGVGFVNLFYREVLGMELHLPEKMEDYVDQFCARKSVLGLETKMLTAKDAPAVPFDAVQNMLIPLHLTGYYVQALPHARALEFRESFYRPGDVFLGMHGRNTNRYLFDEDTVLYIYLGQGQVLQYTAAGGAEPVPFSGSVARSLRENFFLALRPTQGIA